MSGVLARKCAVLLAVLSCSRGWQPLRNSRGFRGVLKGSSLLLGDASVIRSVTSTVSNGSKSSMSLGTTENIKKNDPERSLIGEDSAAFDIKDQSVAKWTSFSAVLLTVLTALYYLWVNNETGFGDEFIRFLEDICNGNSQETIVLLLGIFSVLHSGLASLRPWGERLVGGRAWRVLFGIVSLPLALSSVVYFINHRYDGLLLWDVKNFPGVHEFCWISSFISFWFLYPSTFNLLEVAAVDKPELHMWETGIMRITRHPQFVGQGIWCFAHTLYIGTSFTLITSAMLMAHHLFAVWNGDRRLGDKYGEKFEALKERTSIVPFKAILEGRQTLPSDYFEEFARIPYVVIAVGTVAAYYLHPFMQAGSYLLKW